MSLARWAGGTGGGCFFEDVKCIKNRDSHALRFSASLSCTAETSRARAASPRALRAHESRLRVGRPCHSPERETTRERRGGAVLRSRVQPALDALRRATAWRSSSTTFPSRKTREPARSCSCAGTCAWSPRTGSRSSSRSTAWNATACCSSSPWRPRRTNGAFPSLSAAKSLFLGKTLPTRPRKTQVATPRTARPANPRRPTRLRVAMSAPAQTLPAAAVMDCLHFENKTPPGRAGATGAAPAPLGRPPRGRRPRGAQSRVRLLARARAQEPAAQETQRRERRIRREGRGR